MTAKRAKSRIPKRSIGHRISVSLEDEFWDSLKEIAGALNIPIVDLVKKINSAGKDTNSSSAIRVFVLKYYRSLSR